MEGPPSKRYRRDLDSTTASSERQESYESRNINHLPPEILTKIFKYCVKNEGVSCLISRIYPVCPYWRNILGSPDFWDTVVKDDNMSVDMLLSVCKRNWLINTRNLSLKNIHESDCNTLVQIFHGCPHLRVLRIQEGTLDANVMTFVSKFCSELEELALINVEGCLFSGYVTFFYTIGLNLSSVDLNGVQIKNGLYLFRAMAKFCPNLIELKVAKLKGKELVFPIGIFQKTCPKIVILELHNLKFSLEETSESRGFTSLISFSCCSAMQDDAVFHMLKGSTNLKILDFGRYCRFSFPIYDLPIYDLRILRLSSVTYSAALRETIRAKWPNVLVQIPTAYGRYYCPLF